MNNEYPQGRPGSRMTTDLWSKRFQIDNDKKDTIKFSFMPLEDTVI